MGLRYRIPFKDFKNNSFVVEVHREDYTGEVTELTGAPSCFVVSGTDDDFVYIPVRTSTATLNVLESDLLLDLYSINNQYAPVKLYKNGVMIWTGYIKPEQFTQPYTPHPQSIGVECVSALSTLENVEYKEQTLEGTVTMWDLLKYLIASAKGGYRGAYLPHVYGKSYAMATNVLEEIKLIENNFLNEEMNLMEVLEAVCKFLNWTVHDVGGYLYFVDADWTGEYRLYDEALSAYTTASGNEVIVQNVGYNGSDGNTLDVVPGYNKASVKAINHVFDDVVKDEPYDILKAYEKGGFFVPTYNGADGWHAVRKQFLQPMLWNVSSYKNNTGGELYTQAELKAMTSVRLNNNVFGGILMREADYKCVGVNDVTPEEGVTDFNFVDSVQIRVASTMNTTINTMGNYPALIMKAEHAVYADCAISFDCTIDGYFDDLLAKPSTKFFNRVVNASVECGGKYYNGSDWVDSYATFEVEVSESGSIKSNRTPYTPYKDLNGYVIPMEFFVGAPTITIFCPVWMNDDATHYITGTKIRNLKFGYAKKEGVVDEGENGDRIYENIVNEAYMSDAEEIEFEISSYNADGATYSKALLGDSWLTDNLYCAIVGKMVRPEELMIRRIVNRYGVTKIKLTEAIQVADEITPLTILTERTMAGKRFRMTSGEWDYEQNRMTIQMQEDAE